MSSNLHTLKQAPLFLSLGEKSLGKIASAATNKIYRKREVIFQRGEPGNDLFIIKSGVVKISLFNRGRREAILRLLYKNDFFGLLSLFDDRSHPVTASAVTECEVLIIRKRNFIRVLKENPGATFNLLAVLSHRLRKTIEKVESLAFFDAYGKTARLLLELASKKRKRKGINIILNIPFTRKEMAAMAGVTRETLNRMLNEFQTRGCLKVEEKKITILDEAILKREVM